MKSRSKTPPARVVPGAIRADDWANVVTGLGTVTRDKRMSAGVAPSYQWTRAELLELYKGDAIAALIIDDRAKEMLRKWFGLSLDDDDKGQQARSVMDAIDGIDGLPLRQKLFELLRDGRLFGGAAAYLGVEDGRSPDKPINYDAIESFNFINIIDRYSLEPYSYFGDRLQPRWGEVAQYRMINSLDFGGQRAPGEKKKNTDPMPIIHADRIVRFDGVKLGPIDMLRNGGWGDSVLTRVREIIRDDAELWSAISILMQEYSSAVVKMKGLGEALATPEGRTIVQGRMQGVQLARSVARITLLDGGSGNPGDTGEEWSRDTISLAGMDGVIDRFMQRVAMAARMPMSRLFGVTPGGLNDKGGSDLQWYHEDIELNQELELRPIVNKILRLQMRAKEGPLKGTEPKRWSVKFNPLRQLTALEQATLEKTVADKDSVYINVGVLDPREVAQSRYGGPGFSAETQLDDEVRELMDEKHQIEAEAALKTAERERDGEASPDTAAKLAVQGQAQSQKPAKKFPPKKAA